MRVETSIQPRPVFFNPHDYERVGREPPVKCSYPGHTNAPTHKATMRVKVSGRTFNACEACRFYVLNRDGVIVSEMVEVPHAH